jgi:hypothetical protein
MPIARMTMKLYRRLIARLQFLMRDDLTETTHVSAHARRTTGSRQAPHLQEVQTRGGGSGGLSEGEGRPGTMRADLSKMADVTMNTKGADMAPE